MPTPPPVQTQTVSVCNTCLDCCLHKTPEANLWFPVLIVLVLLVIVRSWMKKNA